MAVIAPAYAHTHTTLLLLYVYLSERGVLDISGVAGRGVGVDKDQLTMVDVKTCLVLLLFDVSVLCPHHGYYSLL